MIARGAGVSAGGEAMRLGGAEVGPEEELEEAWRGRLLVVADAEPDEVGLARPALGVGAVLVGAGAPGFRRCAAR